MLFPICNVGSLSGVGGPGSGHIGGDYAHMAQTALVPTFAEHDNSESGSVASTTGYVDGGMQGVFS